MNNHAMKGMSQILSLVVGAAILMMVAMLLMFSATDVIGGGVGDAQIDSCINQIESQCTVRASFSVPSQCANLDATTVNNRIGEAQIYETDSEGNIVDDDSVTTGNIDASNAIQCN